MRLEFYVEEASTEAALIYLVPAILADHEFTFEIYAFQGKDALLRKLPNRLTAYRYWEAEDWRVIVLVDRDDDDCHELKRQLEVIAQQAGLVTRTAQPSRFQVVNRIAIEELETWFFGDIEAVAAAYPRVAQTQAEKSGFRDPNSIKGGTWERLEQLLKYYHPGG